MTSQRRHLFSFARLLAVLFSLFALLIVPAARPTLAQDEPAPQSPAIAQYADWPPRPQAAEFDKNQVPSAGSALYNCGGPFGGTPGYGNFLRVAYQSAFYGNWDIFRTDGCLPTDEIIRLTNNPAFDGYPRIDVSGSKIVFVSDRGGNDDIYSMDADGNNLQRLTNHAKTDTLPMWSPDGKKVAFVSDRIYDQEIYVMNADGSGVKRLTQVPGVDTQPAWSPDGKKIAWVHHISGSNGRIYVMNADGSGQAPLSGSMSYISYPRWSNAGTQLAFTYDADANYWYDIGLIKSNGTGLKTVNCHLLALEDCYMGDWSPLDRYLYISNVSYTYRNNKLVLDKLILSRFAQDGNSGGSYEYADLGPSFYPSTGSLDRLRPSSRVLPLPEFSPASGFPVSVTVRDDGVAGLNNIWLTKSSNLQELPGYWKIKSFTYDPLVFEFTGSLGTYTGNGGQTVYFFSSAEDWAENREPETTVPDAYTRLYKTYMDGTVTDQRGRALKGVTINTDSTGMNSPLTDQNGEARIYFSGELDRNSLDGASFTRTGFTGPASQRLTLTNTPGTFLGVLTSGTNKIMNWEFEDQAGPLSGWQIDSSSVPVLPSNPGFSGNNSALIGTDCLAVLCLGPQEAVNYHSKTAVFDIDGNLHMMDVSTYRMRNANGQWQPAEPISNNYTNTGLFASPNGAVSYLYDAGSSLIFAQKLPGQGWVYEDLHFDGSGISAKADQDNRIHVFYSAAPDFNMYYLRREANGAWTTPVYIMAASSYAFQFAVAPNGEIHLVARGNNVYYYNRISATGQIIESANISADLPPQTNSLLRIRLSSDGSLHVVSGLGRTVYIKRSPDGTWGSGQSLTDSVRSCNWEVDSQGNIYLLGITSGYCDSAPLFFLRKKADSADVDIYSLERSYGYGAELKVDYQDHLHLFSNSVAHLYYPAVWNTGDTHTDLFQANIHLPETMWQPTLSFFYKLDQGAPHLGASFDVLVSDGSQEISVFHSAEINGWQHAWADLSDWLGKDVSVRFRLSQAAAMGAAQLNLDEVSLTSYTSF